MEITNDNLILNIKNLIKKSKIKQIKKLPNERLLTEILQCKRGQLRNALLLIESEGIIFRKPGSGTFININYSDDEILKPINNNYTNKTFYSSIELRMRIEPSVCAYVAENAKENEIKKLQLKINKIKTSKKWIDIKINTYDFFRSIYKLSKNKYYINTFDALIEDRKESNFDGHYLSSTFSLEQKVSKVVIMSSFTKINRILTPILDKKPEKAFKESKNYLNNILSLMHL